MKITYTFSISTTTNIKKSCAFWDTSARFLKVQCKTMKHRFPHHLNTSCFLCVARRACKNHMWTSTMNNKTQNNKTQTTKHRTTKQTNTVLYIYVISGWGWKGPWGWEEGHKHTHTQQNTHTHTEVSSVYCVCFYYVLSLIYVYICVFFDIVFSVCFF